MNSEYEVWKIVKSQFSQLVLAMNQFCLQIIYLTSFIGKVSFFCRLLPRSGKIVKKIWTVKTVVEL